LPIPPSSRNKLKRFTRRFALETRNYIVRENLYYWGYRWIERQWNQRTSEKSVTD
jgi:hypothetical protein